MRVVLARVYPVNVIRFWVREITASGPAGPCLTASSIDEGAGGQLQTPELCRQRSHVPPRVSWPY